VKARRTIIPRHSIRFVLAALAALLGAACRDEIGGALPPPPPATVSRIVWKRSAGMPERPIGAMAASSFGTMFASVINGGLYRSTDGGAVWARTLDSTIGNSYGIATYGLTIAVATTLRGVLRSTDNGLLWTGADSGMTDREIASVAALPGGRFLAGSAAGRLYRSDDGARTWTEVANVARTIIAIAPLSADAALLSAWDHGVYRFTVSTSAVESGDAGINNPYVSSFAVGPSGDIFAGAYPAGLFRSSTGGASWLPLEAGPGAWPHALLAPSGSDVVAGTDAGVYVSADNGLHWAAADSGMTATNIFALARTPAGAFFAGTESGVFRSTGAGASALPFHHP
jgi:photosystem II stability/assembly factor-like uncharacterized protein